MNRIKLTGIGLIGVLISFSTTLLNTPAFAQIEEPPVSFTIKDYFLSDTTQTLLNGSYAATVSLIVTTSTQVKTIWYEKLPAPLRVTEGIFEVTLGQNIANPLYPSMLNTQNVRLRIQTDSDNKIFNLTSVPYAIRAKTAEALTSTGVAQNIFGTFTNPVLLQNELNIAGKTLYTPASASSVFINSGLSSGGKLSINGIINITGTDNEYLVNGISLANALDWKRDPNNTSTIYAANTYQFAIGTAVPLKTLNVAGTVYASQDLLLSGTSLLVKDKWVENPSVAGTIYTQNNGNVGIGTSNPKDGLHINENGLILGTTTLKNPGAIRWSGEYFQGFVTANTLEDWKSLTGISGTGAKNSLSFWISGQTPTAQASLSNSSLLQIDSTKKSLGLTSGQAPNAALHIEDTNNNAAYLRATNSSGNPVIIIKGPTTSPIGTQLPAQVFIGRSAPVSTQNDEVLSVAGIIDASKFVLSSDATTIQRQFKYTEDKINIYFTGGPVNIGRPDATNVLEISQPTGSADNNPDPGTIDSAITFSNLLTNTSYTIGIDAAHPDVFRVEKGQSLGQNAPIMVAKKDQFGIGVTSPVSNLNVSGNQGVLFSGTHNPDNPLIMTGPGSRFYWIPNRSALQIGVVDNNSPLQGTEFNKIGQYAIQLGHNTHVSGNVSVVAGENNRAGGAYASVLGGQNNQANGDWSFAAGKNAVVQSGHHGTFLWSDPGFPMNSQNENQFLIAASGGVGIGTNQLDKTALTLTAKAIRGASFHDLYSIGGATLNTAQLTEIQDIVSDLKTRNYINNAGYPGSAYNPALTALTLNASLQSYSPQILTILHSTFKTHLIRSISTQQTPLFTTAVTGKTVIGSYTPSAAALAVEGKVSIGSNKNNGLLSLYNPSASQNKNIFLVTGVQGIPSPGIQIDATGNIGIGGLTPATEPISGQTTVAALRVPTLTAVSLSFPDKSTVSTAPPLIVFLSPATPNIYFVSGNVGIGTSQPQSLLEISDSASVAFSNPQDPQITFEGGNGIKRFSMGVLRSVPDTLRINAGKLAINQSPAFTLKNTVVGIAENNPNAPLHVGGKSIFNNKVTIGKSQNTAILGVSSANIRAFSMNGNPISASGTSWLHLKNPELVYWDTILDPQAQIYKYVGIGVSLPTVELEIGGTLNVTVDPTNPTNPSIRVSDHLILNNALTRAHLDFEDANPIISTRNPLRILFSGNQLLLTDYGVNSPADPALKNAESITNVFTAGLGPKGELAIWLTENGVPTLSLLAKTDTLWTAATNNKVGHLRFNNATLLTSKAITDNTTFYASQNVSVLPANQDQAIKTDVYLGYRVGSLSSSKSYVAQNNAIHMNWPIASAWEDPVSANIIGTNIDLKTLEKNSTVKGLLRQNATAYGLKIDVTDVQIQQNSNEGQKIAAVFLNDITNSPDHTIRKTVGIGKIPEAELDVSGTIKATAFNIASELKVTSINVGGSLLSIHQVPGRVGIGTTLPKTTLEIISAIKTNQMMAHGTKAKSLEISNANFVANALGQVGIGTTTPTALLELKKTISKLPSASFTFQEIETSLNNTLINKNINGLNIALQSQPFSNQSNIFGSAGSTPVATGLNIDLSQLTITDTSTLNGIVVTLQENNVGSRNAALFLGGNVGINTSNPTAALSIAGTLFATNVPSIILKTAQEAASFNYLEVGNSNTPSETLTVHLKESATMEELFANQIQLKSLNLGSAIDLATQQLTITGNLETKSLSINQKLYATAARSTRIVTANNGFFNALAVGSIAVPGSGLAASSLTGTIVSINQSLSAKTVKINSDMMNILENKYIGLGTPSPANPVHIQITPYPAVNSAQSFDPKKLNTFNALMLQNTSNITNTAAGISLIPNIQSEDIITPMLMGSGMAAVRSADTPVTGSHLVFITDADAQDPKEQLRITASGNVGLGLTLPQALLHVSGNTRIANNMQATRNISVTGLGGIQDLRITSTTNFKSSVNIAANTFVNQSIHLAPVFTSDSVADTVGLYVNENDFRKLYVNAIRNGNPVGGPLIITVNASRQSIPYLNTNSRLSDSLYAYWSTQNIPVSQHLQTLNLEVTRNRVVPSTHATLLVQNLITSTNINNFTAATASVTLKNRTNPSDSEFNGVDIKLTGITRAIEHTNGLRVNMDSSLLDNKLLDNNQSIKATKIAAVFLNNNVSSGNVGIADLPFSEVNPSADLHIMGQRNAYPSLFVDAINTSGQKNNAMVVSANGFVGIGTSLPESQLHMASLGTGTNSTFKIKTNTDFTVLNILDNGRIGIGKTLPQHALDVSGNIQASIIRGGGIVAKTFTPNTPSANELVVLENGYVGIKTNEPSAQFHFNRQITDHLSVKTAQTLLLNTTELDNGLSLDRSLSGLDIDMKSISESYAGGETTARTITGMDVNLTSIKMGPSDKVVGFSSSVGVGTENRAAIFMGGAVGIGLSNPTNALEVNGFIKAHNVETIFADFDILTASFNSIIVTSQNSLHRINKGVALTTGNTNIRTNTLTIHSDTSSKYTATGPIFATANAVNATIATFNRLAIAPSLNQSLANSDLWVSGSAQITGRLSATQNHIALTRLNSPATIAITANFLLTDTTTNIKNNLTAKQLRLEVITTPQVITDYSAVYVSEAQTSLGTQGDLFFRNDTATVNLTGQMTGRSGYIPFYNPFELGGLNDEAAFLWTKSAQTIGGLNVVRVTIGDEIPKAIPSGNSILTVQSIIPSKNISSGSTAKTIQLSFPRRRTAFSPLPTFIGQSVVLKGLTDDNDTATGLKVDVTDLQTMSSTELPTGIDTDVIGKKYAAVFLAGNDTSGNVGIRTGNSPLPLQPEAELHVFSTLQGHGGLKVLAQPSTGTFVPGLVVSSNAFVAIGHSSPTSHLHIKSNGINNSLAIENSNGVAVMSAKNGNIGIGTSNPATSLNITNTLASNPTLLMVPTSPNVLSMDSTGRLGLGTTTPQAQFNMQFSNHLYEFPVTVYYYKISDLGSEPIPAIQKFKDIQPADIPCPPNPPTEPMIGPCGQVWTPDPGNYPADISDPYSHGYVGVYEINNDYHFYEVYYDANCIVSQNGPCGGPPPTGFGLNTVVNTNITPFQVDIPSAVTVSNNNFIMDYRGNVGIGTSGHIYTEEPLNKHIALTVNGNMFSGKQSALTLPNFINNGSSVVIPHTQGMLAGLGNDYVFLGLKQYPNLVSGKPNKHQGVLIWGNDTNDDFITEAYNKTTQTATEALRFSGKALVGIGQSSPKASLHVTGTTSQPVMIVSQSTQPYSIVVTNNGNVGFGISNPQALAHVGHELAITKLLNAPKGTLWDESDYPNIDISVVRSGKSAGNFVVQKILTKGTATNQDLPIQQNAITLSSNTNKKLIATDITLSGDTYYNGGQVPLVYGLKADVRNLSVGQTGQNASGNKVAAMFLGGRVSIGQEAPSQDVYLDVSALDSTGAVSTSGNVARFSSGANAELTAFRRSLSFLSVNNVTLNTAVSPLAFTVISTISQTDSRAIWSALISNSYLNSSAQPIAATILGDSDLTLVRSIPAIDNNTTKVSQIYNVLKQHIHKDTMLFHVADLETAGSPTSYVYTLSGHGDINGSGFNAGQVAIGFTNLSYQMDKHLNVSGNIKTGITRDTPTSEGAGLGAEFHFSGGPVIVPTLLNENLVPLIINRYNAGANQSELRMIIGNTQGITSAGSGNIDPFNPPKGGLNIGYGTSTEDWGGSSFLVGMHAFSDPLNPDAVPTYKGVVGVGTQSPSASLHVIGGNTDSNGNVRIENTSLSNPKALAISNGSGGSLARHINFYNKSASTGEPNRIGAIEDVGAGAIQYSSPQADYAEYLPKINTKESIKKGDVVGVKNGKITRNTQNADQIMVISQGPVIAGNYPGEKQLNDHELVAFLGQVKTKVIGPVKAGDYLVPSGKNDGAAIAKSAQNLSAKELDQIVGRAWESNPSSSEKFINTVIGFPFGEIILQEQYQELVQTKNALKNNISQFKIAMDTKIEEQQALLKKLQAALN